MEAPPSSSSPLNISSSNLEEDEDEDEYESAVDQMPPGFRFHPTDSEIIIHYLLHKVINPRFRSLAIADIHLNKCEPWDLPQKAGKMVGEKEWFFFFEKETKYPSGTRTNRATASGYWKATGKDREIHEGKMGIVGMKKTLVFYKGRAPKGDKTNWVMHEYRLHAHSSAYKQLSNSAKEKWVVCRVFHKKNNTTTPQAHVELSTIDSFVDRYLVDSPTQLPPLTDYSSLSRKPSSTSAAQQTYQIRPITTSSSTNNNMLLQEFQQHHQNNNFLLDPYLNYSSTNPSYSSQNMNSLTLPYESPSSLAYQDGLSLSMMEWYLTNFPIKGRDDDDDKSNEADHQVYIGGKETERVCKKEAISFDNHAISPSKGTGLSTEMAAAAGINWEKERESKNAIAEGDLCFIPNYISVSDMDFLWSY